MARVKRGVTSHRRHKKVLRQAKGYYGNRSKIYRVANQAVMRSLQYAYAHRKLRKRDFRKLWIARINAACRMNNMSYSRFINGLNKAGVEINRKVLADLAITDPKAFSDLVEVAKKVSLDTIFLLEGVKNERNYGRYLCRKGIQGKRYSLRYQKEQDKKRKIK